MHRFQREIILCEDELETQGRLVFSAGLSNMDVAVKLPWMDLQRPAERTSLP